MVQFLNERLISTENLVSYVWKSPSNICELEYILNYYSWVTPPTDILFSIAGIPLVFLPR